MNAINNTWGKAKTNRRIRNTNTKHGHKTQTQRYTRTHTHSTYKYTHINTARHANTQKIASHMNAHWNSKQRGRGVSKKKERERKENMKKMLGKLIPQKWNAWNFPNIVEWNETNRTDSTKCNVEGRQLRWSWAREWWRTTYSVNGIDFDGNSCRKPYISWYTPLVNSYLQGITQIKEETKTNRNKFTEKISATAAADAAWRIHKYGEEE